MNSDVRAHKIQNDGTRLAFGDTGPISASVGGRS